MDGERKSGDKRVVERDGNTGISAILQKQARGREPGMQILW